MERLVELREAKAAAENVILGIDSAITSLNGALKWSFWDLIGGEFISSYFKRKKIEEANNKIRDLDRSLKILNKELADVHMDLPSEISNTMTDKFLDMWLDNIFTDIRVKREIESTLSELKEFRIKIMELRDKLKVEIQEE